MKILKIIFLLAFSFYLNSAFSQITKRQNLDEQIKVTTKLLEEKNKQLEFQETFLVELKKQDGYNSKISENKEEIIKLLKFDILTIKSELLILKNKQINNLIESAKQEKIIKEVALNEEIVPFDKSKITSKNKKHLKESLKESDIWYNKDIRNPISFTKFIVRNPHRNGSDILSMPSNLSSYHYIKPGSIINILFNEKIYKQLKNSSEISVRAYLKRIDGSIVPIGVSGFFDVETTTNQTEFEKNITLDPQYIQTEGLTYNFKITSKKGKPIQAEVNTSIANPQPQDKLIISVFNVSDRNISFTTTFEYEDFGWENTPSGGFSWVNTINENDSNFTPAGSAGVSFHYKLNKGSRFWANFINPSFGPELVVLQNPNQETNIGLGISVSTFLRTVKVGYGWFLVGENGKPYVSIGVNFIESYKSISSILSRSKE